MEIVERVARAIAVHITESDHNWPLWTDEAEIAVAAVFDALEEEKRCIVCGRERSAHQGGYGLPMCNIYPTFRDTAGLLAQARKEALEK